MDPARTSHASTPHEHAVGGDRSQDLTDESRRLSAENEDLRTERDRTADDARRWRAAAQAADQAAQGHLLAANSYRDMWQQAVLPATADPARTDPRDQPQA